MAFAPASIRKFRFIGCEFDESSATARLHYAFDHSHLFTEEFTFPGADLPLDDGRRAALANCLHHLHLVAGISYYKAAVPPAIEAEGVSPETAGFLENLYLHGLGEFAYRNSLDLRGKIHFPHTAVPAPPPIALPRKTAVPVGGGKDSAVTIEALKAAGEPMVLFALGDFSPIEETARVAGVPKITVQRKLSPLLFSLNREGAFNGHVPISAIIAFTLPVAAVLCGFDAAALSNERSASVGNVEVDGLEVNHQYSKGFTCERDVAAHFSGAVLPGFRYFSFLRPLSELAIARRFCKLTAYHGVFTSCNRAFTVQSRNNGRWCLNCPKCRFVFLALAPFLGKEQLLNIFGADLLDDEKQLVGYDELCGVTGHKPFECVGEIEESLAAFASLVKRPEWQGDLLVQRFAASILPNLPAPDALIARAMEFSQEHLLPPHYENILRAYWDKA